MNSIDKKIIEFVNSHHVLTLATSTNNVPYCCNAFYTYLESENILVFTSNEETKHIKDVRINNIVAGSIVLETSIVGKIQGIQFQGLMFEPKDDLLKKAKIKYLKKFPFAILMNTQLWVVDLSFLKLTDNRLGFGKKIIWEKIN
jgi:uncharacterized protein YhbP (UPF0306 family)